MGSQRKKKRYDVMAIPGRNLEPELSHQWWTWLKAYELDHFIASGQLERPYFTIDQKYCTIKELLVKAGFQVIHDTRNGTFQVTSRHRGKGLRLIHYEIIKQRDQIEVRKVRKQ